jgi:hypothetical protein
MVPRDGSLYLAEETETLYIILQIKDGQINGNWNIQFAYKNIRYVQLDYQDSC